MTWVAVVFTPIVLAYQAWTFWVFRRRISPTEIPAPTGLPTATTGPATASEVDSAADAGARAR
jgi:cytochrome d ubiquinol oxidase subunit II